MKKNIIMCPIHVWNLTDPNRCSCTPQEKGWEKGMDGWTEEGEYWLVVVCGFCGRVLDSPHKEKGENEGQ